LYPAGLEAADAVLAQLDPGRSLTREYRIERPDGVERWVEATLKPHVDDGTLVRIDGIVSDVTESREAQAELAHRNEELVTLYRISELTLAAESLQQAYDEALAEVSRATGFPMVWIEHHDAERDLMRVSAAHGLPDEATGWAMPMHETPSGSVVSTGKAVVEREVRTRNDFEAEALAGLDLHTYMAFPLYRGRSVSGTLTLAHTERLDPTPRLVRWAGSLAHSIAALSDRLASEDALKESEQRYRRLAEQLQQANDELEAFAYSVSHDLRTPLRTMTGFAHALLEAHGGELSEEARDYARRIIESGRRAEDLIRDLLAYSRLSFESLELQPVDLGEVVAEVKDQAAVDLRDSGAEVIVESPLPTVRANLTTLVQVVSNLVSNALKFVPEGRTPRVTIRAEERDDVVRLWVEDNGVGVPEGQEERIFRVFERLDEAAERPGTGIGLAIVRRGMERIGGRAGVEARDEGSAFWIEVPRERKRGWSPWNRGRKSAS
ncbi:MAG: PAS domain S-box protein, partial [Gemmatimonadetes bacterium]